MNSSGNMNISTGGIVGAIGISFAILLVLIIFITAVSYFCTDGIQDPSIHTLSEEGSPITDRGFIAIELGLNEATLASYPKLLYSQAKLQHRANHSLSSSCSICLGGYKDSDVLRSLPDCGHTFHLKCVDFWLRLNPTCPMCRKSPVPAPLLTPIPEVPLLAAS